MEGGVVVETNKSLVRTTFEIMNEMFTAVGSGLLGMFMLVKYGYESNNLIRTAVATSITAGCMYYFFRHTEKERADKKKIVVISGCDSGLGFSLAQFVANLGFTVVAGFLNLQSKGAQEIRRSHSDSILQAELDLTSSSSIQLFYQYVEELLSSDPDYEFYALVNNAGIMIFGEFEWQTETHLRSQIEVNLLGTLKLTKSFCPLLRTHRGRVITVTSHCGNACLPGLSTYGATKAALKGWSDALRLEMNKYGVHVIQFIPGSFTMQSNIMSRHSHYAYEMHEEFTQEQHDFYGEYFKRYNAYLSAISKPVNPQLIKIDDIYEKFEDALLDSSPSTVYKSEPSRYKFYHLLFKFSPTPLKDYFVHRFMQMPEYHTKYDSVDLVGG